MTRVALYARISIDDKKTPAVENQLKNLRELAGREGYEIVKEYADDGISAFSGKPRPGFLDMVDGIRAGSFDVICAVAEDRFTRSSAENIGLQGDCVKHGVTWHTIAGGKVDPATASGGLLATITSAVAQYESAIKKERIKRSVADRLAAGKDLGGPRPFGYNADRVTVFEPEAELLRAGYAMVLEGGAVYAVAKMFTAAGILRHRAPDGPWRPQTVRAILLRPRNAGRLVVKGIEYPSDKIESIIDWDTFSAVRSILENPSRMPRRGPKPMIWAAMGTVRCGVCGSYLQLTGANKKGDRYLRCAPDGRPLSVDGKHVAMKAEKLDAALSTHVRVKLTPSTFDLPTSTPKPVAALQLRVAELKRKRDVIQELGTAPGANIGKAKADLVAVGKEIEKAQADLDEALAADITVAAVDAALSVMVARDEDEEGVDAEDAWRAYWASLSIEDRRSLILSVLPNARLMPQVVRGQNRLAFD